MRFQVLATDYDGTLASGGVVDDATLAALRAVRESGRRLVLVTGRVLHDLERVFPHLALFDRAVLENGAVLHDPARRESRDLAEPPPPLFAERLRERGVTPLEEGRVIVATWTPHEVTVLETIAELGLELGVIFNKGAVMVLPSSVNKATGLDAALAELELTPHEVVGIGDAENDHAFLSTCELSVAVANGVPQLRERADVVTAGDHGAGVREAIAELLRGDLSERARAVRRHDLALGTTASGATLSLDPHTPPILIAGASGSGKSTLATGLLERLAERRYQFCVIDPEGDYSTLELAPTLGDAEHAPPIEGVLRLLADGRSSAVVNLLGVKLDDRPAFLAELAPRLEEQRRRSARPHWVVVDEAHHMLAKGWRSLAVPHGERASGWVFVTVHPDTLARSVLERIGVVLAVGGSAPDAIRGFCGAAGLAAPTLSAEPPASGELLAWFLEGGLAPQRLTSIPTRHERIRHLRKYASGELAADRSFYFTGADGRLKLRAQNLQLFLQIGDGVDDETWLHHLRSGDYSSWIRNAIKDPDLAAEIEGVERDEDADAGLSRARVRSLVEARYTAPPR